MIKVTLWIQKQVIKHLFFAIEFKINDSTDEVIEKWGIPDVYDYFMGGIFEENKEIYNVRIGMTFEEVIAILGEPTYMNTLEQNEGSELLAGSWSMVYDVGEYDIEFVSSIEKGPVDVVYLWGKN